MFDNNIIIDLDKVPFLLNRVEILLKKSLSDND